MKVGDLVKSTFAPTPMGVVVNKCDGLGIPTIDIMVKGSILYDQREEFYEVINEAS